MNNPKDIKTDNSFLMDKIMLRMNHMPAKGEIRVLDCYGGTGKVWRGVKTLCPNRVIKVLGIDKSHDIKQFRLTGDNLSWMIQMDLSRFNVIDLDAYGVPYEQLKLLFKRKYRGIVFVTFIQSLWGLMPKEMLKDLGFTSVMIEKAPSLCNSHGWESLLDWLGMNDVKKIWHRSHARKHYLTFEL